MIRKFIFVVVFMAMFSAFALIGSAGATNLLTNADFEDGELWPSDGWSYDIVDVNTDYNHTPGGEWALKVSVPGAEVGNHFLATPDYTYNMNGWMMSPADDSITGSGVAAFIRLIWKNGSGVPIGDPIDSVEKVTGASAWYNIGMDDLVAPEGTMYGEFNFVLENASAGTAYYDDAYCDGIPPIPEPSTLLLLGTGLGSLVVFARKKKIA